jgi:hypothetical protein
VVQKVGAISLRQRCAVELIYYYVAFMIAGDFASYFIGLFVEYEWGSNASLIVFLTLYFGFLWLSWVLAVLATEPKKADMGPL